MSSSLWWLNETRELGKFACIFSLCLHTIIGSRRSRNKNKLVQLNQQIIYLYCFYFWVLESLCLEAWGLSTLPYLPRERSLCIKVSLLLGTFLKELSTMTARGNKLLQDIPRLFLTHCFILQGCCFFINLVWRKSNIAEAHSNTPLLLVAVHGKQVLFHYTEYSFSSPGQS